MKTLAKFLTTGKLGPLELGMPLEEVINIIGLPSQFHSKEDLFIYIRSQEYWYITYGNLEVSCDDPSDLLSWIAIYFRDNDPRQLPDALDSIWLENVYEMNKDSFCKYLEENAIKCDKILDPWLLANGEPYIPLKVQDSGVRIVIDIENNSDRIYSMQISTNKPNKVLPCIPWNCSK
jgi:hypothetical protein